MRRGGAEREGDTESKADSRLHAVSTEPDTGHPSTPSLLNFKSPLYILNISCLSDIQFVNIFSHSIGYLFILFIVSFAVQKHFTGYGPTCLFFILAMIPRI